MPARGEERAQVLDRQPVQSNSEIRKLGGEIRVSDSEKDNSSSCAASNDLSREVGSDAGSNTHSNTSRPASNGDHPKPLILVVDDLPENLATLSAMVSEDGADVRVANAGPVALRYARLAPQPDLILLDIMMPGMDGRAVLAELLKDPQTAHIPVIFVTALGDAEDEERGLEEGAVDYIAKPIKPAVLRARVRAQLEIKRSRELQANQ